LYVYGYKNGNEGFYNFDGNRTIWDKKSDLENKIQPTINNQRKPLEAPQQITSCGNLTEYGENECIKHIDKQGIKCKWDSSPTSYSGSSVKMSTGGQCVTI
jgi:uncharacterized membrane protein